MDGWMDGWMSSLTERQICPKINDKSNFYWSQVRDQSIFLLLLPFTQSCPTLCDPMDSSLPGFTVHGIFQARILEWAAVSFSRESSQPRDRTRVSCLAGSFFTAKPSVLVICTFLVSRLILLISI